MPTSAMFAFHDSELTSTETEINYGDVMFMPKLLCKVRQTQARAQTHTYDARLPLINKMGLRV
jgi:hypothetical protein